MVREVSIIKIDPKEEQEFVSVYEEVAPILRRQPGYHADELLKVIENEDEYILTILWDSVEAHTNFVNSVDFSLLAEPWGPFQKKVVVRHCTTAVIS
jgi:heme-degrading monooxygenase HmoA